MQEYVTVDACTDALLRHEIVESNMMRLRISSAWIELYIPNCFLNGRIKTISIARHSKNDGAMVKKFLFEYTIDNKESDANKQVETQEVATVMSTFGAIFVVTLIKV